MSESQLVTAVIEYLLSSGHLAYRTNNIPRYDVKRKIFFKLPQYTPRGLPDIHCCLKGGHYLAIECKSSKGYLTKDQKEFKAKVEKQGGTYLCIKSIDDIIQYVVRRDQKVL